MRVYAYDKLNGNKSGVNPQHGQNIRILVMLDISASASIVFSGSISYASYLSTDQSLSSDDLLLTESGTISSDSLSFLDGHWAATIYDQLPVDTKEGTYHYLFVRNYGDRFVTSSPAVKVEKFTSLGAFKIYNSWGKTWTGENKKMDNGINEGYYYLPFEQMTTQMMSLYYYENSITEKYEPTW